jgi:hypothetical protein
MQEVVLAKEHARGQHLPDGQDLSTELEETHVHVDGINGEHAT